MAGSSTAAEIRQICAAAISAITEYDLAESLQLHSGSEFDPVTAADGAFQVAIPGGSNLQTYRSRNVFEMAETVAVRYTKRNPPDKRKQRAAYDEILGGIMPCIVAAVTGTATFPPGCKFPEFSTHSLTPTPEWLVLDLVFRVSHSQTFPGYCGD